jgi:hypothetical protein
LLPLPLLLLLLLLIIPLLMLMLLLLQSQRVDAGGVGTARGGVQEGSWAAVFCGACSSITDKLK